MQRNGTSLDAVKPRAPWVRQDKDTFLLASLPTPFMEVQLPRGAQAQTPGVPRRPGPGAAGLLDAAAPVWFMLAQL